MLYLMPFRLFALHFRRARPNAQPYAVAGMLLGIGFRPTQALLTHMVLAFMLVIMWTMMRNHELG